jgi:hypothetical protein
VVLTKKNFEGPVPAILIQGEHQTRKIDSRIQLARFSVPQTFSTASVIFTRDTVSALTPAYPLIASVPIACR